MATFWLGTVYLALGDYRRAMGFLEWGATSLKGV
jgi:TolA-binding protein